MHMQANKTIDEIANRIAQGEIFFTHCTAYKTRQLSRKVMAHFETSIADLGIKGTQFSLMGFIDRDGPITAVDLALAMELSASTLSRNLQPLITHGWLAVASGKDARSRSLSLTLEGRKLIRVAGKRWQSAQSALGDQVGAMHLAILHDMVDKTLVGLATCTVKTISTPKSSTKRKVL
jgi:DNA-binding MarR family transcriptional regulator